MTMAVLMQYPGPQWLVDLLINNIHYIIISWCNTYLIVVENNYVPTNSTTIETQ